MRFLKYTHKGWLIIIFNNLHKRITEQPTNYFQKTFMLQDHTHKGVIDKSIE